MAAIESEMKIGALWIFIAILIFKYGIKRASGAVTPDANNNPAVRSKAMSESESTALVEYRPILGFHGYRVGNDGSVWSCKVKGGNIRSVGRTSAHWHRLSECPNSNGYSCVNLFRDGRNFVVQVCYLVLEAFVGPRPEGMEACHFPDRNPRNSRADNLRWDTKSGNQADRRHHGTVTQLKGEDNPHAELTARQVLEIVHRRRNGEKGKALAAEFNTSPSNISCICLGQAWSHVTGIKFQKRGCNG
jgi:hypothetical protein